MSLYALIYDLGVVAIVIASAYVESSLGLYVIVAGSSSSSSSSSSSC